MLFRVPFLTGEKYDYDKVLRIPHLIFSSVCREYDRRVCADSAWRHHAVTQLQYRYPTSVVSTENKGSDASKYKRAPIPVGVGEGVFYGPQRGKVSPVCYFTGEGSYQHTISHTYTPRRFFKIPFLEREKAAYLKLRRLGLSINQISAAFGRSTSVVQRTLKQLQRRGILHYIDMRKLPFQARMRAASRRWATMLKLLHLWELWICGEEEEPP